MSLPLPEPSIHWSGCSQTTPRLCLLGPHAYLSLNVRRIWGFPCPLAALFHVLKTLENKIMNLLHLNHTGCSAPGSFEHQHYVISDGPSNSERWEKVSPGFLLSHRKACRGPVLWVVLQPIWLLDWMGLSCLVGKLTNFLVSIRTSVRLYLLEQGKMH